MSVFETETETETKELSAGAKRNRKIKENAKKVYAYLQTLSDVPSDVIEAAKFNAGESSRVHTSGTTLLTSIFGTEEPAQGTSVDMLDVFTKTGKGYAEIRKQLPKWETRGVKVTLDVINKKLIVQ